MKTCNFVGCPCKGTREGHRAAKAYENGFVYYAASYGPRYGDPVATCVSLVPNKAAIAANSAAFIERREILDACEDENCDGSCAEDCVCYGPDASMRAEDLFSPAELREHRRALLAGEVVFLSR